jgi:pimeloyl-ACP methyl ester carboxylesterase
VIPYNFHDMALNTRKLLQSLGITRATIVGHSMGGMLTVPFAASYPEITERAVIYNPIGLTDPRYQPGLAQRGLERSCPRIVRAF